VLNFLKLFLFQECGGGGSGKVFCAEATRASFMTQRVAKEGSTTTLLAPQPLCICAAYALFLLSQRLWLHKHPPSLNFLPVVRPVCSSLLVAAVAGSAWAEQASWKSSSRGLHAV